MQHFRWLSQTAIPPPFDLRRRGWRLSARGGPVRDEAALPCLFDASAIGDDFCGTVLTAVSGIPHRRVLVLGADRPQLRADLLCAGFGDVLGSDAALCEIEARARRIAECALAIPRARTIGRLRLDLFAREGFAGERPLALHPREFALVWRLCETPGVPVSKDELLRQVWRSTHIPGTNSIAVHIFRLRVKLAAAGLVEVIQTAPAGGYFLAPSHTDALAPGEASATSPVAGGEWVDGVPMNGDTRCPVLPLRSQVHAP